MIIEFIIDGITGVVTWLWSFIALPAFPLALAESIGDIMVYLTLPLGVLTTFLTLPFIYAVMGALLAYWLMHPTFWMFYWLYRHIRGTK